MKNTTQQAWLDELVVELRLRNVRGSAIGDAVAQVESFCAESGQSPEEAFGDPREYAGSLEFAPTEHQPTSPREWIVSLLPVGTGLLGCYLASPLAAGVRRHAPVAVSWGLLVALFGTAVVSWATISLLPPLLRSRAAGAVFFGCALAVLAGAMLMLRQTAVVMPVWLAAVAVVALLAHSVWALRRNRLHDADPLVDPHTAKVTSGTLPAATDWIFPIVTLAQVALGWLGAR